MLMQLVDLIEEGRFARDSPLEGGGFEPSVPRVRDNDFETETFERLITFCAGTKRSEFRTRNKVRVPF
jgi:hypothetical protein